MSVVSDVSNKIEKKFHISNDFKDLNTTKVLSEADKNSLPSISFFSLLVSATAICSLGLLINSPAVIIGGMLISPLMWPLMKISLGVATENRKKLIYAIKFLALIILLSILSSFLITLLSPIKIINQEILSRTNPTLLDLVIALLAGFVASLALMKDSVSDRIAGVAITTSLTPPLCVSGIGLALKDFQTATGGFILFFANMISIIFISTLIFSYSGFKNKPSSEIRKKGIMVVTLVLFLTSIPLIYYLRQYTFQYRTYEDSFEVIKEVLLEKSDQIVVKNVRTEIKKPLGERTVFIEADIIIPEGVSIDYRQQDSIISALENKLNSNVNVSLNIQRSISIDTEEEHIYRSTVLSIKEKFSEELSKVNPSAIISSIDVQEKNQVWEINSTLRINPDQIISEQQLDALEKDIGDNLGLLIKINLTMVPTVDLSSIQKDVPTRLESDIRRIIEKTHTNSIINSINLELLPAESDSTDKDSDVNDEKIIAMVDISLPLEENLDNISIIGEKEILESSYNVDIELVINVSKFTQLTF
ncbi:DUF389 domain-containing protein [Patescibacteria group bacterium]|nr:DUF389 domain-containing protein [Patescibacteria group bacterium]